MSGKVWLVGAGPGDAGLITIKGKQVLEQADVIVYDRLVGASILTMIPKDTKTIDVGKRAGHHKVNQEQINQILLDEAMAGKKVVRLKGGDPFLFGRGGEELELLVKHQIPFEIVPGVTSALSVPAYNGIPVTHRDFCSSVHIITGHKKKNEDYDIDFNALVAVKGTLVFLMGVGALGDICNGLLKAKMAPDTPAAILQHGTTATQKRIVATVSTLAVEVAKHGIEMPAIIVIGNVCALADEFYWYEKLPLFGKKIVVTRPKNLISNMSAKLREAGGEVLEIPAIRTEQIAHNNTLERCLNKIDQFQWIVFTSPTGVAVFFEQMKQARVDIRALAGIKIAAIGEGTKQTIEEKGMFVDLVPNIYDAKHLGQAIAKMAASKDRILIPRASQGSQELLDELQKENDFIIEDVPTYDTLYENQTIIDVVNEFEQNQIDYAVFTSASTVKGFIAAFPDLDFNKVNAVCIGKQTKAEADRYHMVTHMAEKATIDHMVKLLIELSQM